MRTHLLSLGLFLATWGLVMNGGQAEPIELDRIVAIVEDQVITESEVDKLAMPVLERLERSGSKTDVEKVIKRAREEVVLRKVREIEAGKLDVKISDEDIEQVIKQVEDRNHLAPGSLAKELAKEGMDLEEYKDDVRGKLLEGRIIRNKIRSKVTVSDSEIEALYRLQNGGAKENGEVLLGHILLAVDNRTTSVKMEEQRNLAVELVRRLREGAPMATLAGQFSDDSTGMKGGVMGWFKRGELLPEIDNEVFKLDKKEVVGPLRSEQGFHIFQVLDRRVVAEDGPGGGGRNEEILVHQILIKLSSNATTVEEVEAKRKIMLLHERLQSGVPFNELADTNSEDKDAGKGGGMGWLKHGSMPAEFEEVAFALKQGEVSKPFRSPQGWHLVMVADRRSLDPNSLDAQRNTLRLRIEEAKARALYLQWLRDKRQRAFVEYR